MNDIARKYGINTYAYTFDGSAADTMRRLADQGYGAVELMFFPGHLWPRDLDTGGRRELLELGDKRLPIVTVNMPNVDMNIAAATEEMRSYTLELLVDFIHCAGEIGAGNIILGPGKANPLFPMPREAMVGHFHKALDRLAPLAAKSGVRILMENMSFAFLPDAESLAKAVDDYGDPAIGFIYDVANAHFIGESPADGLRRVKDRLGLVHFSDTTRKIYRHDPLGQGDVPLEGLGAVLKEVGYHGLPFLEVISTDPDRDIADSVQRLHRAGIG